jgi:hypothetical protein
MSNGYLAFPIFVQFRIQKTQSTTTTTGNILKPSWFEIFTNSPLWLIFLVSFQAEMVVMAVLELLVK